MTQQIPWPRVAIEGFVIVGSILLAFGIEASWATRQERAEEQALLHSLHADFLISRDTLTAAVETHRGYLEMASRVARTGEREPQAPADLLVEGGTTYYGTLSTMLNTGTLDGVLASGRLGVVENERLRAELAAWPRMWGEFAEEEQSVFSWIQEARPLAYGSFRIAEYTLANIEGDDVPVPDDAWVQSATAFAGSGLGRDLAATRARLEFYAVRDGEMLLAVVEDLIRLIEAEIN